jgi:hypothetical protein
VHCDFTKILYLVNLVNVVNHFLSVSYRNHVGLYSRCHV